VKQDLGSPGIPRKALKKGGEIEGSDPKRGSAFPVFPITSQSGRHLAFPVLAKRIARFADEL